VSAGRVCSGAARTARHEIGPKRAFRARICAPEPLKYLKRTKKVPNALALTDANAYLGPNSTDAVGKARGDATSRSAGKPRRRLADAQGVGAGTQRLRTRDASGPGLVEWTRSRSPNESPKDRADREPTGTRTRREWRHGRRPRGMLDQLPPAGARTGRVLSASAARSGDGRARRQGRDPGRCARAHVWTIACRPAAVAGPSPARRANDRITRDARRLHSDTEPDRETERDPEWDMGGWI